MIKSGVLVVALDGKTEANRQADECWSGDNRGILGDQSAKL